MQRTALRLCPWLACLALWLAPPASAENGAIDWPTFQGNNARTGSTDYPAIKFPEIAWSTQVGIMGYLNCPVIDGDRVFVTSSGDEHNQPDDRDGVYCLSLKTGEVLWHYPTSSDACGVTIDHQHVYAGDDAGMFHAIDRETGELAWRYEFNASVFGQPLRIDDLVIAGGAKGFINAFDPKTGKKRWSFHHDDALRAGLSSDGEQIYAVYLHGRVVCFDLTGKVLWQRDALDAAHSDSQWHEFYGPPTFHDDAVYLGFARDTTYKTPAISKLRANGVFEWSAPNAGAFADKQELRFGNLRSSFAVFKDELIFGEPYGNNVLWARPFDGQITKRYQCGLPMFPHWPSPVIAGETMYLARHDGVLHAIDAPQNHNQRWVVYLGDHKKAKANGLPQAFAHFNRTDWKPPIGKPLYATPAIAKDGTIVIGSGEGWLYCIKEKQ